MVKWLRNVRNPGHSAISTMILNRDPLEVVLVALCSELIIFNDPVSHM